MVKSQLRNDASPRQPSSPRNARKKVSWTRSSTSLEEAPLAYRKRPTGPAWRPTSSVAAR